MHFVIMVSVAIRVLFLYWRGIDQFFELILGLNSDIGPTTNKLNPMPI